MAETAAAAPVVTPTATTSDAGAPAAGGNATPATDAAPAKSPAAQQFSDLFDLNINGKVEKVTRDQLISRAQKAEAAERKFREASEATKRVQSFEERLKKGDVAGVLKDLGGASLDEIAEKHLLSRYEREQLTPEQRELAEHKAKIKDFEAKEETRKREADEAQKKTQTEAISKQIEGLMLAAAEKGGLPKTPATLEILATIGMEAAQYGVPLTPEHLVAEFKAREETAGKTQMEKMVARLNALDGDKLLESLPPGILEKVLKASVAKVRRPQAAAPAAPTTSQATPTKEAPAALRPHEFFKTRFR